MRVILGNTLLAPITPVLI